MRRFGLATVTICTLAACAGDDAPGDVVSSVDAGTEADAGASDRDAGIEPRCSDEVGTHAVLTAVALTEPPSADEIACGARVFDGRLDDAEVICLGENDHGVHESAIGHARLLEYLIFDRQVRTIALEGTEASAAHWSRYLVSRDRTDLTRGFRDATGSPANAVAWESFVEFLADVQGRLPDDQRIQLTGFDVAVQSPGTIESILGLLDVVDASTTDDWRRRLQGRPGDIADAAVELEARIVANRSSYLARSSEDFVARLERDVRNLVEGQRFLDEYLAGRFDVANATYREPGMLRNMQDLIRRRESFGRVAMVAHNAHCHRTLRIGTNADGESVPSVGAGLAEALGDRYRTIAQVYHEGRHTTLGASGYVEASYEVPRDGFEARVFDAIEGPTFFLSADSDVLDLTAPIAFRSSRGTYVPARDFDGFFGIRTVTPSTFR